MIDIQDFLQQSPITLKEIITTTFAIAGYYFAYRRYQKDKELEIVSRYVDKFQEIAKLKGIERADRLFELWSEEFYMRQKRYIGGDLWKVWCKYIDMELSSLGKIGITRIKALLSKITPGTDCILDKYRDFLSEKIIQNEGCSDK